MYAIISFHDKKYQPLGDITWDQNKVPYAERHGYKCVLEELTTVGHDAQMHKVDFINRMLNDPAGYEWVWWTGCDLMITNFNIKMEDKIDNDYEIIIATDCNGINSDSILIRNSQESRDYWAMIKEVTSGLYWHWEGEQKAIKDSYPNYKHHFKIVPQREINSYDYSIFPKYQGNWYPSIDHLGTDGNWQPGDWVIQWPGILLEHRVELAKHFSQLIVK